MDNKSAAKKPESPSMPAANNLASNSKKSVVDVVKSGIESKKATREKGKSGKDSTNSIIGSTKGGADKMSVRNVVTVPMEPSLKPKTPMTIGPVGSRFQTHQSVSKMISQRLGAEEFSGRDGIITAVYRSILATFSFAGAAIAMAIDGRKLVVVVTLCQVLLDSKFNVCANITAICTDIEPICNGTRGLDNCTDDNNNNKTATEIITATSYADNTNGSRFDGNTTTITDNSTDDADLWFECASNLDLGLSIPESFDMAVVFVLTLLTTIGYGHVVVTGHAPQIIVVAYSLFTIPLFFEFLNGLAATVCDRIAKWYDRLVRKPLMKKRVSEPAWMTHCPDLVPFSMLFVFVMVYVCVVAGVFQALNEFEGKFGEAMYFVFISILMIGFGDVVPSERCQLGAMVFIIFGIILMALVSVVQEQWIHQSVERLVDTMTGTRRDRFAEQTLEALMKLASEKGEKLDDLLKKKAGSPSPHLTAEASPYVNVDLNDPYNEMARQRARTKAPTTVHARKMFSVRFAVKDNVADDSL